MKPNNLWRSFLLALASLGTAGCAIESPTAPPIGQSATTLVTDALSGLITKDVLTRKKALTKDITVAATIGKEGGRLTIPAAGFELVIPPGAVGTRTKFTVTAVRGTLVAYEFGPHGTQFAVPLRARQDLSVTNWRPLGPTLVSGYFLERSHLDQGAATALVSEVISGLTDPLAKQFGWRIEHFSGYVVAW